jgi:AraC-like DNA-binding protein
MIYGVKLYKSEALYVLLLKVRIKQMIFYQEYKPCVQLAGNIKSFYILVHTEKRPPSTQRITPDGSFEINFNLANPLLRTDDLQSNIQLPPAYILLRSTRPYFVQRAGEVKIAGIKIYPWGLQNFTSHPAYLLADKQLPINELLGADMMQLHERIGNTNDNLSIIRHLEDHFLKLLSRYKKENNVMAYAMQQILKSQGQKDLKQLAGELNISARRLQQQFRHIAGCSPKMFCRLTRFRCALRQLSAEPVSSLTSLAYDNNYFDQSHFIRDFTLFSGLSPKKYLMEKHALNDILVAKDH